MRETKLGLRCRPLLISLPLRSAARRRGARHKAPRRRHVHPPFASRLTTRREGDTLLAEAHSLPAGAASEARRQKHKHEAAAGGGSLLDLPLSRSRLPLLLVAQGLAPHVHVLVLVHLARCCFKRSCLAGPVAHPHADMQRMSRPVLLCSTFGWTTCAGAHVLHLSLSTSVGAVRSHARSRRARGCAARARRVTQAHADGPAAREGGLEEDPQKRGRRVTLARSALHRRRSRSSRLDKREEAGEISMQPPLGHSDIVSPQRRLADAERRAACRTRLRWPPAPRRPKAARHDVDAAQPPAPERRLTRQALRGAARSSLAASSLSVQSRNRSRTRCRGGAEAMRAARCRTQRWRAARCRDLATGSSGDTRCCASAWIRELDASC